MKAETCFVTGGAGFIGCAISRGLADRFARVIAIDNLHPQVHADRTRPDALDPRVELVVADVCEAATWDTLLASVRPNAIVHLAAETGTGQSLLEGSRHAMVNVVGTTQMLDALARHNAFPAQCLLTSSRAVYGEGAWVAADNSVRYPGCRTREQLAAHQWDFVGLRAIPSTGDTTFPAPVSTYAATKLTQEHILRGWAEANNVKAKVLRLQNVYGVGQSLTNPYTGIVSLFCRLAKKGESIPLYEDGAMLRDFVYIDDVARAILCALDASQFPSHALDVGTGVATTIADVANIVAALYQAPPPHVCHKVRYGDVRHASCRIEPTMQALGWAPQFDVKKGIEALKQWVDAKLLLS